MQRNLILLPAVLALSGGHAALGQCEKPIPGRLVVIGGAYVAGEAAMVLIRHEDWWPDSARAFNLTWGESPSANQDGFLHATIAYQAAQATTLAFDWACVPRATAGWLGSLTGIAIALPKEIGDGFHGTGFSGSDMLFTAAGAALPGLHRAVPSLKAMNLKATYWPSAELRNRIGSQPHLETDYAGQRFFLTFSPGLLPGGSKAWPPWLGAGVGHGTPAGHGFDQHDPEHLGGRGTGQHEVIRGLVIARQHCVGHGAEERDAIPQPQNRGASRERAAQRAVAQDHHPQRGAGERIQQHIEPLVSHETADKQTDGPGPGRRKARRTHHAFGRPKAHGVHAERNDPNLVLEPTELA
jgi:hypothetical protein